MNDHFQQWQQRVEATIKRSLPTVETHPERLHQAMHYALFNGGKRIRPMITYATAELLGIELEQVDPAAAAIEMIHAYSLIHDDLPAMDDDALRRGQPTCHMAFDEATAILAGDALQTAAFETLVMTDASSEIRLGWIQQLAFASGAAGMVGGQMIDLESEQKHVDADSLRMMHNKKTGALIQASVLMGATPAQPGSDTLDNLQRYAETIGLAFQVQDDILDVEGESAIIGKPQGSDQQQGKSTFVSLFGVDGAKRQLSTLYQQSMDSLSALNGGTSHLAEITHYVIQRDH